MTAVRFKAGWQAYQPGDVAVFERHVAEALIAKGIAAANKTVAAPEPVISPRTAKAKRTITK